MKPLTFIWILAGILLTPKLFGQGEIAAEDRIFFRNERTFSGNLYSNGWSANFRYAFRQDAASSFILDADFATLKHPKEVQSQSIYLAGWGRRFVFGKLNEVGLVRAGAGYQKELFRKFDQGGISLRYFGSAGLTLGMLKPIYYYQVLGFNPLTNQPVVNEGSLFDPDYMQSTWDIYDKRSFFIGLGETTFNPGVFARIGLCFEYSNEDQQVRALEGGVQMEGFLRKMPILASTENNRFFISLYAGYRFGRVVDARFKPSPL